jgi:nitrate/nitrite transporter NarK
MTNDNSNAGIREVYQIANRLEAKIDLCVTKAEFSYAQEERKESYTKLFEEVEKLKNWKFTVTGFAAAVGAVGGYVIEHGMRLLNNK